MGFVVVFIGAGIGGMLRHLLGLLSLRWLGPGFPYGTLVINITGSAVMGLVIGYLAARNIPGQLLRLFLTTGILGGYTTFSTFSLDSVTLWERGEPAAAIGYVLASVVLSLAALFGAMLLMRQWGH
jgi:CrcB protein